MSGFSIGEVEKITKVKSHVLRYWEEVIPSLAPTKNLGGRRTYSRQDLQIILRLKYLIQEKKYTIEGARNQIIDEAAIAASTHTEPETDGSQNSNLLSVLIPQLNSIRWELLDLYEILHKNQAGGKT